MLLRKYVQYVLLEGRLEDAKKKYPKLGVEDIAQHDPSGNLKYLDWMLKQFASGDLLNGNNLYPTVAAFHRLSSRLPHKDINAYPTLKSLEDAIKNLPASKRSQTKEIKASGAERVGGNKDFELFYIKDKKTCVTYGKGTRWCITMEKETYWEQYTGSNVIFYFALPKSEEHEKYAIAMQRDEDNNIMSTEVYNAADDQISGEEATEILGQELFNIIDADAPKRPASILALLKSGRSVPVEELDDYLDSLGDDEKAKKTVVRAIDDDFNGDLWWLYTHTRHELVKIQVVAVMPEPDFEKHLPEIIKSGNIKAIHRAGERASDNPENMKLFATVKDSEVFVEALRHSESEYDIVAAAIRSGNEFCLAHPYGIRYVNDPAAIKLWWDYLHTLSGRDADVAMLDLANRVATIMTREHYEHEFLDTKTMLEMIPLMSQNSLLNLKNSESKMSKAERDAVHEAFMKSAGARSNYQNLERRKETRD